MEERLSYTFDEMNVSSPGEAVEALKKADFQTTHAHGELGAPMCRDNRPYSLILTVNGIEFKNVYGIKGTDKDREAARKALGIQL